MSKSLTLVGFKYLFIVKTVNFLMLVLIVCSSDCFAWQHNPLEKKDTNPRLDDAIEAMEILTVVERFGDQIWEGFGASDLPLVIYDDDVEYLYGYRALIDGWDQTQSPVLGNRTLFRSNDESKSFAIELEDGLWAGSIRSLRSMNEKLNKQVQDNIPKLITNLFSDKLFRVEPDHHVFIAIHELFHAFQATRNETRFKTALQVYQHEKVYPFLDRSHSSQWDEEGRLLAMALEEIEIGRCKSIVNEFIKHRKERRIKFKLTPMQIAFESELEWLEGLGKYTEIVFHERVIENAQGFTFIEYKKQIAAWRQDMNRLSRALGQQKGDQRFYLSGMAQARLLDRFGVEWKEEVLDTNATLTELLAKSVQQDFVTSPLNFCQIEDLVEIGFSRSRVVMINEAHDGLKRNLRTRLLGRLALPRAHALGVRHLAMEAVSVEFADEANRTRMVPKVNGNYLAQEEMRALIRTALDLGWSILPYEADLSRRPTELNGIEKSNWRERAQAVNLANVIRDFDERTKVLVWCGNGHLNKVGGATPIGKLKPMGLQFWEISGIEPFAIDQVVTVAFNKDQERSKGWLNQYRDQLEDSSTGSLGFLIEGAELEERFPCVDACVLSIHNELR